MRPIPTTRCQCGKIAFETLEAAKREAKHLTWRNRKTTREKVKPYFCTDTGIIHIGRGPRGGATDQTISI